MPVQALLRLDGYVRVSDVRGRSGPSFISPTLQRERIEAWCALYGARLLDVFEELDESGGRPDRPLLLETFLKGRTAWPLMEDFKACGKEQLRRALIRFGGAQRWAHDFELPMSAMRGPHLTWTEDKIDQAIRELVGDREVWPKRREFSRAGLDGCYAAMWRTGGTDVWAARIGVRLPAQRGGRRSR